MVATILKVWLQFVVVVIGAVDTYLRPIDLGMTDAMQHRIHSLETYDTVPVTSPS